MHYGEIKKNDIANGIGVRVSLFVSGCRHHCPDCFNAMTWDFGYGKEFDKKTENEVFDLVSRPFIRGLTLIGGEPMEVENQRGLINLIRRIKTELPHKDIWCYSGFTFEELTGESRARCEITDELLSMIDVLVDGRFMKEKKNIMLRFRGSENQRLIDLKKTFQKGNITLWDE